MGCKTLTRSINCWWHQWLYRWRILLSRDKCEICQTRNVGQYPTWWSPCQILVAASVQRCNVWV